MDIQNSNMPHRRANRTGLFFALLAIAAGALILVFNTGAVLALYKPIIFSWPMLVTVIGFYGLVSHRHFSFSALFVMIVGIFFLIPRIGASNVTIFGWDIPYDFAATYWPVLLIAAGVFSIIRWIVRPQRAFCSNNWKHKKRHCRNHSHRNFGKGDINTVFGNSKHVILDPVFEGGDVNAVFGEITLDLRKTELPEGKTPMLEVNIVFGNAIILVPESWNIKLTSSSVMGAFIDKRDNADASCDTTRTLEICVDCVCGGGELRN